MTRPLDVHRSVVIAAFVIVAYALVFLVKF